MDYEFCLRKVKYLAARKLYIADINVVSIFDGVGQKWQCSTKSFIST